MYLLRLTGRLAAIDATVFTYLLIFANTGGGNRVLLRNIPLCVFRTPTHRPATPQSCTDVHRQSVRAYETWEYKSHVDVSGGGGAGGGGIHCINLKSVS